MRTTIKIITAFAFNMLMITAASAQTNFSGTWNIDKTRTDFGIAPQWVPPAGYKISQNGSQISITHNNIDAQGNASSYTENFTNGDTTKTHPTAIQARKAVLTWSSDKSIFSIDAISISDYGTSVVRTTNTENWSLEDNGQALVITRQTEQSDGLKYAMKVYYTKGN